VGRQQVENGSVICLIVGLILKQIKDTGSPPALPNVAMGRCHSLKNRLFVRDPHADTLSISDLPRTIDPDENSEHDRGVPSFCAE